MAVDTNVLINLGAGQDYTHTLREVLLERGYTILVPPTVVRELAYLATEKPPQNAKEEQRKHEAHEALVNLRGWGFAPFDLKPVGRAIAGRFVDHLTTRGLLPVGEFNDGEILAETSLASIPVLVTQDGALLSIDADQLRIAFGNCDLEAVTISHPSSMLRALTR